MQKGVEVVCMDLAPVLPAPKLGFSESLFVLLQFEFDDYLTGGEYHCLAISAPDIHIQLYARAPWLPTFEALLTNSANPAE